MKKSPFKYGTIVTDKTFINQVGFIKKLQSNFNSGINTIIMSPRRWGKSSLVEKVISLNKDKNIKFIAIDMFSISNKEEFLTLLAKNILSASSTKIEELVSNTKSFLKNIMPNITIQPDAVNEINLSFSWDNKELHDDEILNLAENIYQEKGIRFVICIDEFQSIASFDNFEYFEKKMRSIWQRQSGVTYCLYGSKRHMMDEIFNNSSKPFYKFGDVIFLPRIDNSEWVNYIKKGFKNTGKKISGHFAKYMAEKMGNHSWYVQQLAHFTWQKTEKEVSQEIIDQSIEELILANIPFFQNVYEGLSQKQVYMLKAIASGELHLNSAKTVNQYKLGTPGSITKNKRVLAHKDIIDISNNQYMFLDPVFEIWFKKLHAA